MPQMLQSKYARMKLKYSIADLAKITDCLIENPADLPITKHVVEQIFFDTRKIADASRGVFFALDGERRSGTSYIEDAYQRGVRYFVVPQHLDIKPYPEALFLRGDSALEALQKLASYHRSRFDIPVIAITGSVGKTIVKEWLFQLLSPKFNVVKSPKSYNSQLGVALSLLEINHSHQIALIEAGISQAGEMDALREMIQPNIGIFTAFGAAHKENFESVEVHFAEKIKLFQGTKKTYFSENIPVQDFPLNGINPTVVAKQDFEQDLSLSRMTDAASRMNLSMALAVAKDLGLAKEQLDLEIPRLIRPAMRMETLEGIHGITLINDTYNLDLDALKISLEYQLSIANKRNRTVLIALDENANNRNEIEAILAHFSLDKIVFYNEGDELDTRDFANSVLLVKGSRSRKSESLIKHFRMKVHNTRMEIDLTKIRSNLNYFRSKLKKDTKTLAMIKASSYGSGSDKMSLFLEENGVDYFGVAYADEGVELRKQGVKTPIIVMNVDEDAFESLLNYDLEPSLFDMEIMDSFVRYLIQMGREAFPIHVKLDTGMSRLGFTENELTTLFAFLHSQPEIKVKSIFSHLADADGDSDDFSAVQLERFQKMHHLFTSQLAYFFDAHILNTEGILKFTEHQYSMVRLGIGLYGICASKEDQKHLQEVVSWKTHVSQIKHIAIGQSVGYNRRFVANRDTYTATIPVGYADGFRRSLGSGVGSVVINGHFCPVLGNVCMDMAMVDVTDLAVEQGDEVEIIGATQNLVQVAAAMNTIVYEVLTGIAKRVPRIYLEE